MRSPAAGHDLVGWLEAAFEPRPSNAAEFWYDRMDSQSGRSLPIVYQPFDGRRRAHFVDQGRILDFHFSAGSGRLLDFGPGDGWPSLPLALMGNSVVGVDGSARRVSTCEANAARLGVASARFVHVPPGEPLPFGDASFDGATAASSLESSPDPRATLRELCRVLRPGGRLRLSYESLAYYLPDRLCELATGDAAGGGTRLLVFQRDVERELTRHVGMLFDCPPDTIRSMLGATGRAVLATDLRPETLTDLRSHVVDCGAWATQHPSVRTLLAWLRQSGFSAATPTHDGGTCAGEIFDSLADADRPLDIGDANRLLAGPVAVACVTAASRESRAGRWDPWITATR